MAAAATANRLYYDPARPTAFPTPRKLGVAAMKKKNIKLDDIRDWLEKQDAYTFHRSIRKRFARNPYTVKNVMDVWECDLVDVRAPGRFNDNYKYILSVIDVFFQISTFGPSEVKDRYSRCVSIHIYFQGL